MTAAEKSPAHVRSRAQRKRFTTMALGMHLSTWSPLSRANVTSGSQPNTKAIKDAPIMATPDVNTTSIPNAGNYLFPERSMASAKRNYIQVLTASARRKSSMGAKSASSSHTCIAP